MSRPFRLLSLSLAALSLGLAGCRTSTVYTSMYSPRKSFFVAPPEKTDKAAEDLLGRADAALPDAAPATLPGGLPPADPNAVPGLPAATPPPAAPAADPLAPPPAN